MLAQCCALRFWMMRTGRFQSRAMGRASWRDRSCWFSHSMPATDNRYTGTRYLSPLHW